MAANNACRACAQSPVLTSLTDQKPSPSIVLRVHHTLEVEFESWKNRPLQAHYRYLFADGNYFSVIYDGQEHKIPILAVIGISLAGEREVCVHGG